MAIITHNPIGAHFIPLAKKSASGLKPNFKAGGVSFSTKNQTIEIEWHLNWQHKPCSPKTDFNMLCTLKLVFVYEIHNQFGTGNKRFVFAPKYEPSIWERKDWLFYFFLLTTKRKRVTIVHEKKRKHFPLQTRLAFQSMVVIGKRMKKGRISMGYEQERIYIGDMSQLFMVKEYRWLGGRSEGTRAVDIRNNAGVELTLLPDRCMDPAYLTYKGKNLSFITPAGVVHPSYYDNRGEEFLRSFTAGLLTTCGLTEIGNGGECDGEISWPSRPGQDICPQNRLPAR